jgi:Uri superfamily endonuclease
VKHDRRGPPGTYLLLLHLAAPTTLTVGRLGPCAFLAGWYVYVGSALSGLDARLRRHIRRGKPLHWHVDALREAAELASIVGCVSPERLECQTAATIAALPGATRPIARFGSSDCRCPSHLIHFRERPKLRPGDEWAELNPAELDHPGTQQILRPQL